MLSALSPREHILWSTFNCQDLLLWVVCGEERASPAGYALGLQVPLDGAAVQHVPASSHEQSRGLVIDKKVKSIWWLSLDLNFAAFSIAFVLQIFKNYEISSKSGFQFQISHYFVSTDALLYLPPSPYWFVFS